MDTSKAKVLLRGFIIVFCILFSKEKVKGQSHFATRWQLGPKDDIVWNVALAKMLPHSDHLEMSGRKVSVIVTYAIDHTKRLKLNKLAIWPAMILKYDYRSYLKDIDSIQPNISIDGKEFSLPTVDKVRFNGILEVDYAKSEMQIIRRIFPSPDKPVVIDQWEIKNTTSKAKEVTIEDFLESRNFKGADTNFTVETRIEKQRALIKPGETCMVNLIQRCVCLWRTNDNF